MSRRSREPEGRQRSSAVPRGRGEYGAYDTLQAQFRLSRAEAAKVRQVVLAQANGHAMGPGS